ncbi:MAG: D-2-hydroxyacid dehydrogenase [Candidatus Eisenbacteria bacterium]
MLKLLIVHERAPEYARLIREELPGIQIVAARDKAEIPPSLDDVGVILAWRFPKEILRAATGVRWVASTGAGVDHLLVSELSEDVVITKAPPIFGRLITEYVLGYVLSVSLRVEEIVSNRAKRLWVVPQRAEVAGKLMGILGMGTIGTRVAKAARALDMRVWGMRRTAVPCDEAERVFGRDELSSFLPELDFLVMTLPLTPETRNLIGAPELSLLRPTCWIVNVGRGRIVNEESLVHALEAGQLGGYVSDVFSTEPLPADSALWTLPNSIVTPHYGALTKPDEFVPHFAENVRRFLAGRPLLFQVDRRKGY